jgi:hypothetical protein
MHLGIGLLERDVVQSFFARMLARALNLTRREVDSEGAAAHRRASSITGGLSRAAADVKHALICGDGGAAPEMDGVPGRRCVVRVFVSGPVIAVVSIPRLRLFNVAMSFNMVASTA